MSPAWAVDIPALGFSFLLSLVLTPLVRAAAVKWRLLDHPSSPVKTHEVPTPVLGGAAIFLSFLTTLFCLRLRTHFPSGTLHSLRALVAGGSLVFALGVADDLRKPAGLGFKSKFLVQALAAAVLIWFGIRIRFISPVPVAVALTMLWVVGISNALNIIDIMDGLSASQAAAAALAFLLIALPGERLYVNAASAALAGASLGFLPWNLSKKAKIFMGDSGSLFLGFELACVSLGTDYSSVNPLGVYAPLLVLAIPIFDTVFVAGLRIRKGQSPFVGSKDHFALRLERLGWNRRRIVFASAAASALLGLCAFLGTTLPRRAAVFLYAAVLAVIAVLARYLSKVPDA